MDKYKLIDGEKDTVAESWITINDNMESLRSNFSGNSFPVNPVKGQISFVDDVRYTWNGSKWLKDEELHRHDENYYTKSETDSKIKTLNTDKAAKFHKHKKNEIIDFPTALPANGGNAETAIKLLNARKINGIEFDGTKDIIAASPLKLIATITSSCIWYNPIPSSMLYLFVCGSSGGGGGGGGARGREGGSSGGAGGCGQIMSIPLHGVSSLNINIGAGGAGGSPGANSGRMEYYRGGGGGAGGNTSIQVNGNGSPIVILGGAGGGGGCGRNTYNSVTPYAYGLNGGTNYPGMEGSGATSNAYLGSAGRNFYTSFYQGGAGGHAGYENWGGAGTSGLSAVVYIYQHEASNG